MPAPPRASIEDTRWPCAPDGNLRQYTGGVTELDVTQPRAPVVYRLARNIRPAAAFGDGSPSPRRQIYQTRCSSRRPTSDVHILPRSRRLRRQPHPAAPICSAACPPHRRMRLPDLCLRAFSRAITVLEDPTVMTGVLRRSSERLYEWPGLLLTLAAVFWAGTPWPGG